MPKVEVESSDLEKVLDVLERNSVFHHRRDEMNAEVHLSRDVRYSPITSETEAAKERVSKILRTEGRKDAT